jgi:[ribosomal protein S18]-alanine N-acetyltransferase
MNTKFTFSKMTEPDALSILEWRYEKPYDFYDPKGEELEKDVQTLVEPTNLYLAVRDREGSLMGYYCFGGEAQVPGGDYTENALDVGGGVRPDLLGTGMGMMFVRVAIDFGNMFFHPTKFRTTIAAFNTRALHMCEKAGFVWTQQFTREDGTEFIVLVKEVENEG